MGDYVDRPDADSLWSTRGRVTYIRIDQTGSRDDIRFGLDLTESLGAGLREIDLRMFLDEGTTVALAQLQVLRDAMIHGLGVKAWFHLSGDMPWFVYRVEVAADFAATHPDYEVPAWEFVVPDDWQDGVGEGDGGLGVLPMLAVWP